MTIDTASPPRARRDSPAGRDPFRDRLVLYFGLTAFLLPLLYAVNTAHVWEDFYITFRFSKNLVEGYGLTYNPPQRVHGFTSPLGVLLPALFYWVTRSEYAALWLFRVLSATAFAGAGILVMLAARRGNVQSPWLLSFLWLTYLLDAKSVVFTASGMETGIMLFFVGWGIYLWTGAAGSSWRAMGVCWAGLLWTRPDGCFYIAALVAGTLVFPTERRRAATAGLLRAAAICATLYLPWFIFAWAYYGSPVPQTIVAKGMLVRAVHADALRSLPRLMVALFSLFPSTARIVLEPIYARGDWPEFTRHIALATSILAASLWAVPRLHPVTRRASLAFFALVLYLCTGTRHPWHAPPIALVGLFAIACSLAAAFKTPSRRLRPLLAGAAVILLTGQAYIFVHTWRVMKIQQAVIEDGVRTRVGLWLRDNVRPGETVFLEPLGYIGFFSHAKMIDFPGLVSPQVVPLVRKYGNDMFLPLRDLEPDWAVLRAGEALAASSLPFFQASYQPVVMISAAEQIKPYENLPGRTYRAIDALFVIYRRLDLPVPPAVDPRVPPTDAGPS